MNQAQLKLAIMHELQKEAFIPAALGALRAAAPAVMRGLGGAMGAGKTAATAAYKAAPTMMQGLKGAAQAGKGAIASNFAANPQAMQGLSHSLGAVSRIAQPIRQGISAIPGGAKSLAGGLGMAAAPVAGDMMSSAGKNLSKAASIKYYGNVSHTNQITKSRLKDRIYYELRNA